MLTSVVLTCPDALLPETHTVGLLLLLNQPTNATGVASPFKVDGEDQSVDEEHKAAGEDDEEVSLRILEEGLHTSPEVVRKHVVADPHVGDVEPQGQHDDAEEEQDRPELGVRGELEGDHQDYGGEAE